VAYFCKRHHKVFCYRTAHAHECDGTFIAQFPWLGKAFIWALRQAKAVFSQNKDDARNLLSTTGISAQTIPNGHKMPTSQPVNKDVILWVGRSVDFKKPQLFLDLARQHPQNEFVMICQEATGEKGYDDLIAQAGMLKNLQFIERVGFNEIDDYFLRAKVLVNTSDAEGFPNTFIQACKAATPILSLNVNPDGFLDEYNCGLCCDGNTEKMATELETIVSTQAGADMGTNARKYVEQTHDISKIVDRYKEIFRTIKCR
jgi:glycosyltransferase involved in cell wall biosynthesis